MNVFRQKNRTWTLTVFMVLAMFISICVIPQWSALAAEQKTGVIVTDWVVDTKQEPSPTAEKVNGLENGKPITVLEEVTGSDEALWYRIAYVLKSNSTLKEAYVPADTVTIEEIVVTGTGTMKADNVTVRNEAGVTGTYKLVSLFKGDNIEIISEKPVENYTWYRIRCISEGITHIGWVRGDFIVVESSGGTEEDPEEEDPKEDDINFEEELRNKGFPESYIQKLCELHTEYPNWVFEPVITNLEWSSVLTAETKPGVNLVELSANDAKKSTASTEYNWTTNTWTIRDGAGWVTAHPDYIAHRLDPRNYFNERDIFQFECLTYSSSHSLSGVQAIIKNSFMEGTNGVVRHSDGTSINYAETFMKVGEEANVSPYHLASRVRQEQGRGTSPLISGTYSGYEGLYNYFNIKATGSTTGEIYKNGLTYARQQGWTTRYAALKGGAKFLASSYISVGQDTLYFQKFDVIEQGGLYWHQYMTGVDGAYAEGRRVANAYTDKQQAFVFRIPVYKNMPSETVTFTASGNRNNYLKSLSISGFSLTPTFKGDVTEYSLVVEHDVSSITVSADSVVEKATVSGTGTHNLRTGTNEILVKCKSESGDTKTYTLTVVREEPPMPEWSLTSNTYIIGDTYITGISPQTQISALLSGLKAENCTVKVLDASGNEKSGIIATGDKVEVYCNNTVVMTRQIVIYGDVNGDGIIDVLDIIRMNRHALGLNPLNGIYLEAGDANRKKDGVDVLDIIITNRHTLGLTTIKQK